MGKRILFGGLLAVGLSLALGGTAQAQFYGPNSFVQPRHYSNHGHYHSQPVYRVPVYHQPVYRVPVHQHRIHSPYFGFGPVNSFGGFNSGFNRGFNSGFNRGFNNGFGRPGLSIGFNFFR